MEYILCLFFIIFSMHIYSNCGAIPGSITQMVGERAYLTIREYMLGFWTV